MQVEGRNYLVPVDVQLKAGSRISDAMLEMDTIMAGLDDQVRTNILIMDACRNNPMAQQTVSAGANRGIEAGSGLAAPTSLGAGSTLGAGTLIAYATAPGLAKAPTARSRRRCRATSARQDWRCSKC